VTRRRIRGTVEIAYRTDRKQVLLTILWCTRLDRFSRRVLAQALCAAGDERCRVRIQAFSAAARDLIRHTLRTLTAPHGGRPRGGCFPYAARDAPPDSSVPELGPGSDELFAAIGHLRNRARLRPRLTVVEGAEAAVSLQEALSALQGICGSITDFVEQVLQPLARHRVCNAVRAFVLATRAEFDDLAARLSDDGVYVQSLTVTKVSAGSACVELEASLGPAAPLGSPPEPGPCCASGRSQTAPSEQRRARFS